MIFISLMMNRKELEDYFDLETIPSIYGGKCTCPGGCVIGKSDENVQSFSVFDVQGDIHSDIIKIESGKTKTVQKKRLLLKEQVELTCQESETISWTFRSLNKDIAFGAVFIPSDSSSSVCYNEFYCISEQSSVLWQTNRVQAHKEMISGSYTAYCEGKLQLIFDNSYSKMTSKTIAYDVIRSFDE